MAESAEPDAPGDPEPSRPGGSDAGVDTPGPAADEKQEARPETAETDKRPDARKNEVRDAKAVAAQEDLRKRATDPSRRRDERTRSRALRKGAASLRPNVYANTVFMGQSNVGAVVGRDNHSGASGPRLEPSGPVSTVWLDDVVQTFVPPPVFEKVCERLRAQPLLVLRARHGWGRTTTAMSALNRECDGVYKLEPGVWLPSLDIDFSPGAGYFLEAIEIDHMRALQAFHLEQLSRTLTERNCRLILVLDRTIEPSPDLAPFLLDGGDPPDVARVVRRHLVQRFGDKETDVLQRDEVARLLTRAREDQVPARELVMLAADLAEVARGRADFADVEERYSAGADSRFRQWFEQLDGETRPFAIALAVFNGMPLHVVSTAGRTLARLIADEEAPEGRQATPVFGTRTAELLTAARACRYNAIEETDLGRILVDAVKFVDDRFPLRVLKHVWHE